MTTQRIGLLLAAFHRGRSDAQHRRHVPYKDPERAKAWECGYRFQKDIIDGPIPKSQHTFNVLRKQVKGDKC